MAYSAPTKSHEATPTALTGGGVGGQGGGLLHNRPGAKLEGANETQRNHREEQQEDTKSWSLAKMSTPLSAATATIETIVG